MRASPRLLLVLSAAAFGGTWVAAPWAVAEIPALAVAAVRFAIAAALLVAWCLARGVRIDPRPADLPIILGVAATSVVGYNLMFLYGIQLASPSLGAVVVPGSIPIVTLILASVLFGERVAGRRVVGASLAVAGLTLVVGPALGGGMDQLAGLLLFEGGALAWAVYSIIGRAATKRFDAAVITMLSAALGAVVFLVLSLVLEPGGFAAYESSGMRGARAVAGVLYLGTFGTVVPFVFFYVGVQRIGASRAAAYSVLIPLFGVALTTVLLEERLEPFALVGAAIVIAGLWLMQSNAPGETPGAEAVEGG